MVNVTGKFVLNLRKMRFLFFFEIFDFFIIKASENIRMLLVWHVSSTSPSGGNQVDGLPPVPSTETIAKLARLGPAKNGTTLENFIEFAMF